ncbi:MAG: aldolase/citrate lyase family protein [Chloroflexota bacterium]
MADTPRQRVVLPGLKSRLQTRPALFGPILFELATPGLAVTLADAGFDFLFFDLEHATLDSSSVARTILAGWQAGLGSVVKLADLERSSVQRYLDYGAMGIQVPHVESAEEAHNLVRWSRYPPDGARGQVFGVGNTAYRDVDHESYGAEANREIMLLPMIETRRGVERAREILDVEGLDAVFIGTGDLSSSYGVPGQMTHPIVVDAAQRVIDLALARDLFVAINAEHAEAARGWMDRGARIIAYSSDLGMIRGQARAMLEPFDRR